VLVPPYVKLCKNGGNAVVCAMGQGMANTIEQFVLGDDAGYLPLPCCSDLFILLFYFHDLLLDLLHYMRSPS